MRLTEACNCIGTDKTQDGVCTVCYGTGKKMKCLDECDDIENIVLIIVARLINEGWVAEGYRINNWRESESKSNE